MIFLTFAAGVVVGMILTLWGLVVASKKVNKRRKELYTKAGGLWTKASELFETAKIWHAIGDAKSAADALTEAQRLAKEAEKFEDEANGR